MKTTNELAAVQGNPGETWDEERIAATGLVPELEAQGGYKGPIDGLFVLNGQPALIRATLGRLHLELSAEALYACWNGRMLAGLAL